VQQPLPRFLAVRLGDLVVVQSPGLEPQPDGWWMGQVLHTEGGARDSDNSLFQIACVDTGVIRTVSAGQVLDIVCSPEPESSGALEPAHDHTHQHKRTGQGHQQGDRHGRTWQQR
jgi:hypothetical protein